MTHQLCKTSIRWILTALVPLVFITGCAVFDKQSKPEVVPEIRLGILKGYLPSEVLPDSLALIPPPPATGSSAYALDEETSRKGLSMRGTPRWKLAAEDANLMFPQAAGTFSCALNAPITEQDTPHLYMLLRRTLADAGLSTYTAKNHYKRTRPFVVNKEPTCTPEEESHLVTDGSYPSGHTAIGWAWALILSEISPGQADAILARGRAFGESRIICNVHWQSDVFEGRFVGAAAVARLHADPTFRSDMEAARTELIAVRAKKLKPVRDCRVEAGALARQMEPFNGKATILQSWQGDYPVIQLELLPDGRRDQGIGFIGDAKTFAAVWKAFKPGESIPEIDFKANMILFARNTQFYNRISIGSVNVKDGVAEILAMETMSAMPIKNSVAMALVAVPRQGITDMRTNDKNIIIQY